MATPATLLPLPQVLAGLLGQLGVPEPPGIPRKNLPPKSQGLRGEPGAELGAGIPALPGLSATSHQKSPPSLYPGPGLLHRQQRNSPLASEQSRNCPQGRGCRGTETSGVAPGGGFQTGVEIFGGALCPPEVPDELPPPWEGARRGFGPSSTRSCSHPSPSPLEGSRSPSPVPAARGELREGCPGGFGVGRGGDGGGAVPGAGGAAPAPTARWGCSGGCSSGRLAWP